MILKSTIKTSIFVLALTTGLSLAATYASANHAGDHTDGMMGMGLSMPEMNAERGRVLFAEKGCVVCHSINGVGGEDAPAFDASTMDEHMNPFEFAARMWRGAEAMIILQRDELGEPIELNGQELADIIAFVHHDEEQKKFSKNDIPLDIQALIEHADVEEHEH